MKNFLPTEALDNIMGREMPVKWWENEKKLCP